MSKLIAFQQWTGGLWNKVLRRVDPKGVLRNPFHKQIEAATGRRIRVLIAPLGSDPVSLVSSLLLSRSIRRGLGQAVDIVSLPESFFWSGEESFDHFAQQRARAQELLKDNHCDILIVRQEATGSTPLLRLINAETRRQTTYWQIEKFDLPIFFTQRLRHVFNARLFVAASQTIHMTEEERLPVIRKLMGEIDPATAPPELRGWTLVNWAFLYRLLGEPGSNDDLKKSVQTYHDALKEFSREQDPLAWASVQDDLGTVLRILGEKEQDPSTLQQAVAAFNEALSERTRERAPMQWATTQSNLGMALASLGTQKQTSRIEEAVTAFQAALTEWTRERVPLDWARIQSDLGRLLVRLGTQSRDTARLGQAVVAFRTALEERRHERLRPQWAMTQHNLGTALLHLGEYSKGTSELHEAVTAFRAALQERKPQVSPRQWSATQNSLGLALTAIGVREADRVYLQQAVAAYQEVLTVRTRQNMPVEWAATQNDLGTALLRLAELENDPVILKEAVTAFEATLLEKPRERKLQQWAATQCNLGDVLVRLAKSEAGTASLDRAVTAYRSGLEAYEEASVAHAAKITRANLMAAEARLKAVVDG